MSRVNKGFTLIELLVVVAILGILAAVGIVAYNGYVTSAKINSVKNALQQAALGQTEFYTDNGTYYPQAASASPCLADADSTVLVETNLLGGSNVVSGADLGFNLCVSNDLGDYRLEASNADGCLLTLDSAGVTTTSADCPWYTDIADREKKWF